MSRRHYTKEFKLTIIELLNQGKTSSSLSKEYGICSSNIRRWKKEFNDSSKPYFTGNGNARLTEVEKENLMLKKQLRNIKIERDILKKEADIAKLTLEECTQRIIRETTRIQPILNLKLSDLTWSPAP